MNTIVILADSFRADHLGCYAKYIDESKNKGLGPTLPVKTPSLDRLAKESSLFYHAYPESMPSIPVRTSLFTGRYTFPFRRILKKKDILLSDVLGRNGVETGLVTDLWVLFRFNYDRGFKSKKFIQGQKYDFAKTSSCYKYKKKEGGTLEKFLLKLNGLKEFGRELTNKPTINWLKGLVKDGIFKREQDTFVARTMRAAESYLDNHKGEDNLFLWVDSLDPHEPWNPPPPFNRMYNKDYDGMDIISPEQGLIKNYLSREELFNTRSLYAGEISLVDKYVGKFVTYLKEEGLLDNSLLIFLSDHGEPLGEKHGELHERIIKKARPWLYQELIRIPLMIRHPEGYGAGESIGSMVQTCDIMPTILDYMNVEGPSVMDGESLIPLIKGEKDKIRDYAYIGKFGQSWSIRTPEYSFHRWMKDPPELYNLTNDLYEKNNIIREEFGIAKKLDSELEGFIKELWKKHSHEKKRQRFGLW